MAAVKNIYAVKQIHGGKGQDDKEVIEPGGLIGSVGEDEKLPEEIQTMVDKGICRVAIEEAEEKKKPVRKPAEK